MRAMGPGSVSSLLKTGLDVFWFALIAVTASLAIFALAALVIPRIPDLSAPTRDSTGALIQTPVTRPMLAGGLAASAVYAGVLLLIVRGLRRIFLTLVAGDPFQPENINRLRLVGVCLAALAALNLVARVVEGWIIPGLLRPTNGWPDLTAWFAVLVVFVLAEVFREGARLRREAELTI
jgi:hypothetical protein